MYQCFNLLQQKTLETCVKPYLRSWFENAICPIQRVVQLFQEKLAFLLHAVSAVQTQNASEGISVTPTYSECFFHLFSQMGVKKEEYFCCLFFFLIQGK